MGPPSAAGLADPKRISAAHAAARRPLGAGHNRRGGTSATGPCRRIGEKIAKIPDFPALHLVLVNPGVPVSTAAVFRALSSYQNEGLPPLPQRYTFDLCQGGQSEGETGTSKATGQQQPVPHT